MVHGSKRHRRFNLTQKAEVTCALDEIVCVCGDDYNVTHRCRKRNNSNKCSREKSFVVYFTYFHLFSVVFGAFIKINLIREGKLQTFLECSGMYVCSGQMVNNLNEQRLKYENEKPSEGHLVACEQVYNSVRNANN